MHRLYRICPHPVCKEEGEEGTHAASPAPEEQTVPELIDAVADKMDTLVEEAKKLLQQLRDR